MEINIGDYINGDRITQIIPDVFVKGQTILLTDRQEIDFNGDRTLIGYRVTPCKYSKEEYDEKLQQLKDKYLGKYILDDSDEYVMITGVILDWRRSASKMTRFQTEDGNIVFHSDIHTIWIKDGDYYYIDKEV